MLFRDKGDDMFGWKSDRDDEFRLLQIVLLVLLVGAMVAGLIEFNARRQAAALTREMLREATPEERAQMDRQLRDLDARLTPTPPTSSESDLRPRHRRTNSAVRYVAPLQPGERCLSGQRFRRLKNGWEEIGTC